MTNNMKQALQAVLDLEPTLTPYGLILHKDSIREGRTIEGARENFGLKGFTLAYEYCRSIATIETINRKTTNYGLKHTVEHYYDYYIANGEFIAGAIAAGFKHHYYGPNACFNMSAKSLREKRFGKTGEPLRGDGRRTRAEVCPYLCGIPHNSKPPPRAKRVIVRRPNSTFFRRA